MKTFDRMNKFEQNEAICSQAFIELLEKENSNVEPIFPANNYSPYDAYFEFVNNKGVLKHYFVELKQRNADYDSFILEQKKLEGMRKQALLDYEVTVDDCVFLYVNFTPEKTVTWNISNVDNEIKTEEGMFNKATSKNTYDKKVKSVYYLPVRDGQVSSYVLDREAIVNQLIN